MKKILLLISFCFLTDVLFPQTDDSKNSNVELPDFVITGSDIVAIQKGKKIEPGIIPILNEKFLKPSFSPEDLIMPDLSDPLRNLYSISDSLNYFRGKLEANAGVYVLPSVILSLSNPFNNGLFQLTANGKNQRAYVDKSERYFFNAGLNMFYQLENESAIFNGTKFQLHADYGRTSYKLFAFENSVFKRDLNKGNISIKVDNLLGEKFNYIFTLNNDIHSLQDNIYSENLLTTGLIFKFHISELSLGLNTSYKVQFLKNDIANKNIKDYLSFKPYVSYIHEKYLKASFGFNYFNFEDQDKLYPYLSLGVNLNDKLTAFAEYSPQVVFLGNGHFLDLNPYFNTQNFINISYKKENAIHLAIKYEYDKFYQINWGLKYFSSTALPYFRSSIISGSFDVRTSAAKSYTAYLDMLFHAGPFGYFYGSAELNQTKASNGKILPYHPAVNLNLIYGFDFQIGLNTEVRLNYKSKQYKNITNTESLNPFINLGAKLTYKLEDNLSLTFSLNNLLNRKDYLWQNYQEMPLDAMLGLIYRW